MKPEKWTFPYLGSESYRNRTLIAVLVTAIIASCGLTMVAPAHAQDSGGGVRGVISGADADALFVRWLTDQQYRMARVEAFAIEADVDHFVDSPTGEQVANYGLLFRRTEDADQGRGEIRYFVINGDTLDVSERRRVERIISSLVTEELGPMLNGLNLPTRLLSRVREVGDPVRLQRDGVSMVRYVFELRPPERRPGLNPSIQRRPGSPPQGARRPPLGRTPMGGPPTQAQPQMPPRIQVFIEESTERLVMTRLTARLAGDRQLTSETRFHSVQGIDIPLERSVWGTYPMRRRLRTVTVALEHETQFRVTNLVVSAE